MGEDIEGVARDPVYHRQAVDLGGDEGLDGLVQVSVRLDTHERPLFVLQLLAPRLDLVVLQLLHLDEGGLVVLV